MASGDVAHGPTWHLAGKLDPQEKGDGEMEKKLPKVSVGRKRILDIGGDHQPTKIKLGFGMQNSPYIDKALQENQNYCRNVW